MLTDTDLVEWQLRVAAGEPLPAHDTMAPRGHVFEARIYAEQPERGFLPSTGHLERVDFAPQSDTLRVETGVRTGDQVEAFYDPLLAKLVVRGRDRATALEHLRAALDATRLEGVATNLDFLARLSAHPAYVRGGVDTGFVDRFLTESAAASDKLDGELMALACLYRVLSRTRTRPGLRHTRDPFSPWATTTGWRLLGTGRETLDFVHQDTRVSVGIEHKDDGLLVDLGGRSVVVTGHLRNGDSLDATVDAKRHSAKVTRDGSRLRIHTADKELALQVYDPFGERGALQTEDEHLRAPLPGTIVAVYVRPGEQIEKGTAILAVEAMKMEHVIKAPRTGILESLRYEVGDRVDEHDELAVIKGSSS